MTQPNPSQPSAAGITKPRNTPTLPVAPAPGRPAPVPKEVACPICATHFDPYASSGRCPVCGEQVVPVARVTHEIAVVTPTWQWLKRGGWRLVLVVLVVIYQLSWFFYLLHAFVVSHFL